MKNKKDYSLAAGIVSVLLMATVPAMRRQLSENLSAFWGGGITSILSGVCIATIQKKRCGFVPIKQIDKRYWLLCAIPYIVYNCTSHMATGLAGNREGAIIAGLFTQLWPLGGLVFSVAVLKQKTTKWFPMCCLLGILGLAFSTFSGSLGAIKDTFSKNGVAILAGMIDPIAYGIYSAYYCLLVDEKRKDYYSALSITLGIIMLIVAVLRHEVIKELNINIILSILFQVVFTGIIATELWQYSLRSSNRIKVLLISNLTPVISTVFSAIFLGVKLKWQVILGSMIIVVSVMLSNKCMLGSDAK